MEDATAEVMTPIPEGHTLSITIVASPSDEYMYEVIAAEARNSEAGEILAFATVGEDLAPDTTEDLPDWAKQALGALLSGEGNLLGTTAGKL